MVLFPREYKFKCHMTVVRVGPHEGLRWPGLTEPERRKNNLLQAHLNPVLQEQL